MDTNHITSLEDINETNDYEEDAHEMKKYIKMNNFAKMIKHEVTQNFGNNSHKDKDKQTIDHRHVEKRVSSTSIIGKPLVKWLIIVLNVIIELFQAVLTQEAAQGFITKANYGKLRVVSSIVCVIISIFDIVYEAKEGNVKWRRRGVLFWMYYPGKQGKMFGSFWVVFGFVSSVVQFLVNMAGFVSKKPGFVGFDYLPLLLSVFLLVAAFGNGKRSILAVVKCGEKHGEYEIVGRFVHGSWVFECPSCMMEKSV